MRSLAQRLDMVRPGVLASLLLVFGVVSAGRADLIAYEGFDYAAGDLRGENGGEGDWTALWSAGMGFGEGFSWQVGPPSLGYTDSGGRVLVTTGRSVEADGGEHREARSWNTAGHKDDGDVVWFSFLFRRDTGATSGHHIFIVGANHDNGIGVFLNPTNIGARINNQGMVSSAGHKSFTAGEDHFVVGRITFSDTMEDEVRFWLDPELDAIPLDTAVNSGAASLAVGCREMRGCGPPRTWFVLAFGHDLPVGLEGIPILGHRLNRISPFDSEEAFTSANAAALAEYQNNILTHVRDQFDLSSVQGVEIMAGDPEPGAINIYFLEKFPEFGNLGGRAYTGIDRFNTDPEGGAAIIVHGFQADNPNDFEFDAETVTHEIGHLLGLRHVDPPNSIAVMDYDHIPGDTEVFTEGIFNLKERPEKGGTVFPDTHNPTYHLYRYVDGWSHEDLEAANILPSTWDLPGAVGAPLNVNFTFGSVGEGDPAATLFDVLVLRSLGDPDEPDVLDEIGEITLGELAEMTFRVSEGEGIGLVAKSMADGEYDIVLASGNPFESEALILYPGLGQVEGFLQMASALPAGFQTLAEIMLAVSIVPELLPGDYNADGSVDAADYIVCARPTARRPATTRGVLISAGRFLPARARRFLPPIRYRPLCPSQRL